VTEEELDIILEGGLRPIDRSKVHLSGSIEKALEAGHVRTEDPLILKIDGQKAKEDGLMIYQAGKDVYVTDQVEAKYLSQVDEKELKQQKKEAEQTS
jgi:putative RNA 2'-phosphotransferase